MVTILLEMMASPFCLSPFSKHSSVVTEPVKQRKNINQSYIYLEFVFYPLAHVKICAFRQFTDCYFFFCLICQFRCQMHKYSSGCKRGRTQVDSDPRQWHRHQGKQNLRGAGCLCAPCDTCRKWPDLSLFQELGFCGGDCLTEKFNGSNNCVLGSYSILSPVQGNRDVKGVSHEAI